MSQRTLVPHFVITEKEKGVVVSFGNGRESGHMYQEYTYTTLKRNGWSFLFSHKTKCVVRFDDVLRVEKRTIVTGQRVTGDEPWILETRFSIADGRLCSGLCFQRWNPWIRTVTRTIGRRYRRRCTTL